MRGDLVPLVLLAPLLIAAAAGDLRRLRIPNALVLATLGLFVLTCPLVPLGEIGLRVMAGAIAFSVGFALFSLRLFGGGDVKLFAALMLFVPSQEWRMFLQLFAFSMLIGSAVTVGLQSAPVARHLSWESARRKGHFPMGISIALAGLLLPLIVVGA